MNRIIDDSAQIKNKCFAEIYDSRPWQKYYDAEVSPSLEYPEITVQKILEEAVSAYSDRVLIYFQDKGITYSQSWKLSNQIAVGLQKIGVKKGERIGLLIPNMPQFILSYFGILKTGAVVVALNPLYSAREIEHQLNDAGVDLLITHEKFYQKVKKLQPKTGVKRLVLIQPDDVFSILSGEAFNSRELPEHDLYFYDLVQMGQTGTVPDGGVTSDDVALLQYTGGTTGVPKGAVVLHRNLVANTLQLYHWTRVIGDEGKETLVLAIPMSHIYGMVCGILLSIRSACSIVLLEDPRDLNGILSSIEKYHGSFFHGVPTLYNAINNHPDVLSNKFNLSSLKLCNSGSAPLMKNTKDIFEKLTGARLTEGYGLSEAPTCTHTNPTLLHNRTGDGSFGVPLQDTDARVVSLEDGETILPPGEIGELIVRGPQVSSGYHNMPEETASTYCDGWLHTGDIVQMDEKGFFFFIDRKKELIKPGGFQVWPREVEEVLTSHPAIVDAAVGGIPDPYRGETVKAWVVIKPGEKITVDEIRAWCKENLAAFKVPTHVEFRTELPKSHVGKTLRRELTREHKERNQDG